MIKLAHLPLVAAIASLLASCSTPASRISRNPALYNGLDAQQKALVRQGRIAEGMGKDAVWLAWGRADRIATGARGGRPYERWSYTAYEPFYGPPIGYGGGSWYGPYSGAGCPQDLRYTPDPWMGYMPYEARRVEFVSDRVAAWAVGR